MSGFVPDEPLPASVEPLLSSAAACLDAPIELDDVRAQRSVLTVARTEAGRMLELLRAVTARLVVSRRFGVLMAALVPELVAREELTGREARRILRDADRPHREALERVRHYREEHAHGRDRRARVPTALRAARATRADLGPDVTRRTLGADRAAEVIERARERVAELETIVAR